MNFTEKIMPSNLTGAKNRIRSGLFFPGSGSSQKEQLRADTALHHTAQHLPEDLDPSYEM